MKSESNSLFDRQTAYLFRGIAIIMVILSHYAEWWAWFLPTDGKAEDFRLTLTKLGIYGVNIFFFFSAYGLTKAAEYKKVDRSFILRRMQSVYLPYLIIVGIIHILSGGFSSFSEFVKFLYGHDYWFMAVLFLFYIGFIMIWSVWKNPHMRMLLFFLYTLAVIKILFDKDMQSFWYVSNLAFPLGIFAGTYETGCRKALSKAKIPLIPLSLAFVVCYMAPEEILYLQMINTVLWTWQLACIAAAIPWRARILTGLGKCSLYLYLLHTYIFMTCVNYFQCSIPIRFFISTVVTVIVAVLSKHIFFFKFYSKVFPKLSDINSSNE